MLKYLHNIISVSISSEVEDERGNPLTNWVIYKEWLVYKLIKLILSHSYVSPIKNHTWFGYYLVFLLSLVHNASETPMNLGYVLTLAWITFYVRISCSLSVLRASPAYFNACVTLRRSLSIFDGLVVSVKVSLSYNKQVANLSLKTCIEVLTVKDLVRTMSELCQCDRLWTLYMFLPCNPTLETSPLGMVIGLPKIVVA